MNDTTSIAPLIQAGGVVAFAALVWWELRAQRMERAKEREESNRILSSIKDAVTAILERDRMRSGPTRLPDLPTANER